jgi:hypothetical protein
MPQRLRARSSAIAWGLYPVGRKSQELGAGWAAIHDLKPLSGT